jgi:hypothetical protein
VRISVELFQPLPSRRRSDLERDAERLAAFYNGPLRLTIAVD